MNDIDFKLKVFNRASLCHHFEEETFRQMEKKNIKFPVYLSSGQEFISSTIAQIMEDKNIEPVVFNNRAFKKAIEKYGVGSGSSPLISGYSLPHKKLEKDIDVVVIKNNKDLEFGPATAAPAHCSVVETTFTFKFGQTTWR